MKTYVVGAIVAYLGVFRQYFHTQRFADLRGYAWALARPLAGRVYSDSTIGCHGMRWTRQ